jgi:hypothetical protein
MTVLVLYVHILADVCVNTSFLCMCVAILYYFPGILYWLVPRAHVWYARAMCATLSPTLRSHPVRGVHTMTNPGVL